MPAAVGADGVMPADIPVGLIYAAPALIPYPHRAPGNGDIGIPSDGSSTEKVFNISKGDFWEYNGSPLKLTSLSTRTDANVTVSLKAHIYGGNTEPPDETIRLNSFKR